MSDLESGDSDHEGFIPNLLQIKSCLPQPQEKSKEQNHSFEPHYLEGTPLLRKQLKQSYKHSYDLQIRQTVLQNFRDSKLRKQLQKQSAFNVYNCSSEYCLVYSRYKDPLGNGQRLFQNEVKLKSAFTIGNSQIYRNLREQEFIKNYQVHQKHVIFDSKFECGNLLSVYRCLKEVNTYELMMQSDTNTYGYSQWFYFSMKNIKPNVTYTFRIVNFKKRYSFFKRGMKPMVFSLNKVNKEGNGWYRDGHNIKFYTSNFHQNGQSFYTLQFQIMFQHQNDYLTLSPYPPYSYSKLIQQLKTFQTQAIKNDLFFEVRSVARSLGGNNVPYVKLSKIKNSYKPAIVILARQHSGQIWSSFLAEELIKYLVNKKTDEGSWLLQTYNFHIFPMINVDGVIYGNFRCDIAGYDLNRCWKDPSSTIHPQIYKIKQVLEMISYESKIQVCLDLHTHSRDLGVFAYCCAEGESFRAVPNLVSRLSSMFRYRACTFGISSYKQSTARAFLYELSKSSNILTIQMSIFGFRSYQTRSLTHFSQENIKSLAKALLQAMFANFSGKPLKNSNTPWANNQIDLYTDQDDMPVSGSDSQPEADEIQLKTRLKKILPKSVAEQVLKRKKVIKKVIKKIRNIERTHAKTFSEAENEMKNTRYMPKPQKTTFSVKNRVAHSNSLCLQNNISKVSPHQNKSSASKSFRPFHFSFQFPASNFQKSKFFQTKKKPQPQKQQYQPFGTMQFSLKKLPIFASETLPDSYKRILNQNQSLMLATMALPNKFHETRMRTEKVNSPQPGLSKGQNDLSISQQKKQVKNIEQFPFLCIMSENKRQAHLQKIKQRRQQKGLNRTHGDMRPNVEQLETQCVSKKIENQGGAINKLFKQKHFLNMETLSKRWTQNCNKYKMNLKKN